MNKVRRVEIGFIYNVTFNNLEYTVEVQQTDPQVAEVFMITDVTDAHILEPRFVDPKSFEYREIEDYLNDVVEDIGSEEYEDYVTHY